MCAFVRARYMNYTITHLSSRPVAHKNQSKTEWAADWCVLLEQARTAMHSIENRGKNVLDFVHLHNCLLLLFGIRAVCTRHNDRTRASMDLLDFWFSVRRMQWFGFLHVWLNRIENYRYTYVNFYVKYGTNKWCASQWRMKCHQHYCAKCPRFFDWSERHRIGRSTSYHKSDKNSTQNRPVK